MNIKRIVLYLLLLLFIGVMARRIIGDPTGDYSRITRVYFEERYGWVVGTLPGVVKVTITKDQLQYEITPELAENDERTIIIRDINEETWEELIELMKKYQVEDWDIEGNNLYENYNAGPSHHVRRETTEYVRQGDFFNLNPEYTYLGIDQNELNFRTNYQGNITVFSKGDINFWPNAIGRTYQCLGVPLSYNEFRQELWDFVIEYTGGDDWRIKLGQVGQELMHQTFPYMTEQKSEENPYQNIRYFSIMENYGGKEIGPKASFTYDGGKNTFVYAYPSSGRVYSIAENKQPFLYYDATEINFKTINAFGLETTIDENGAGVETLKSLLEKYDVLEWEPDRTGEFYSAYVNQGSFFNIDNSTGIENENEKWFRSTCDILINIICSDGAYKEIHLQNGKLPQTYNQFRAEFWDYFIEYSYRNEMESLYKKYEQSGFENRVLEQEDSYAAILLRMMSSKNIGLEEFLEQQDWRNYLDEQGYQFMLLKYPYMDTETGNSE